MPFFKDVIMFPFISSTVLSGGAMMSRCPQKTINGKSTSLRNVDSKLQATSSNFRPTKALNKGKILCRLLADG